MKGDEMLTLAVAFALIAIVTFFAAEVWLFTRG